MRARRDRGTTSPNARDDRPGAGRLEAPVAWKRRSPTRDSTAHARQNRPCGTALSRPHWLGFLTRTAGGTRTRGGRESATIHLLSLSRHPVSAFFVRAINNLSNQADTKNVPAKAVTVLIKHDRDPFFLWVGGGQHQCRGGLGSVEKQAEASNEATAACQRRRPKRRPHLSRDDLGVRHPQSPPLDAADMPASPRPMGGAAHATTPGAASPIAETATATGPTPPPPGKPNRPVCPFRASTRAAPSGRGTDSGIPPAWPTVRGVVTSPPPPTAAASHAAFHVHVGGRVFMVAAPPAAARTAAWGDGISSAVGRGDHAACRRRCRHPRRLPTPLPPSRPPCWRWRRGRRAPAARPSRHQ